MRAAHRHPTFGRKFAGIWNEGRIAAGSRRRQGGGRRRAELSQQAVHGRYRQGDADAARFAALCAARQDHRRCHHRRSRSVRRGGFFLDVPRALADRLDRLNFYKLRAKAMVGPFDVLNVMALWDGAGRKYGRACDAPAALGVQVMRRPRGAGAVISARAVPAEEFEAHPRAGRAPRRPGFQLWRRVSPRGRHGPASRRRFRQGLLCRPGGGVAHGTSRHCPHPRRAGRLRRICPRCRRRRDRLGEAGRHLRLLRAGACTRDAATRPRRRRARRRPRSRRRRRHAAPRPSRTGGFPFPGETKG